MVNRISFVIVACFISGCFSGYAFGQSEALRNVEILMLEEKYARAAKECAKVLVHHHQSQTRARTHYLLGICLLKEADYAQARKNFRTILQKYPRSQFCDDAALSIADAYFLAGDFKTAKESYKQFLKGFPRSELTSIARMHLGLCEQGKPFANSYFSVQLGCFANKENAERLRGKLIGAGYQAYILQLPGDSLYHVRVGRFNNRLEAEFLEQQLKTEGYATKVCP